jgi:hypothetical protein
MHVGFTLIESYGDSLSVQIGNVGAGVSTLVVVAYDSDEYSTLGTLGDCSGDSIVCDCEDTDISGAFAPAKQAHNGCQAIFTWAETQIHLARFASIGLDGLDDVMSPDQNLCGRLQLRCRARDSEDSVSNEGALF